MSVLVARDETQICSNALQILPPVVGNDKTPEMASVKHPALRIHHLTNSAALSQPLQEHLPIQLFLRMRGIIHLGIWSESPMMR